MKTDVDDYVEAIPAEHRPLFDRIHNLVLQAHPEVLTTMSYGMPTYRSGDRKLHVGVWKHGVSIYGWHRDNDGDFVARHPKLQASTGTIRVTPQDAVAISDAEFLGLIGPALDG